jgi:hypothetical protein
MSETKERKQHLFNAVQRQISNLNFSNHVYLMSAHNTSKQFHQQIRIITLEPLVLAADWRQTNHDFFKFPYREQMKRVGTV